MKLSNKILIGFFGFLFLYLTAVFAEIRLRGTPALIDETNSIAETIDAPGITFLVLRDLDESVNIIGSEEQARLEVRSFTGDYLKLLTYSISGDTLTLSGLKATERLDIQISVYIPKAGLKGIRVDSAVAIIGGLQAASVHITQNDGRVWIGSSRIASMHVTAAEGSILEYTDVELDTLTSDLDRSQLYVTPAVSVLKGSMTNGSYLQLRTVDDIQFRKDESSKINMY